MKHLVCTIDCIQDKYYLFNNALFLTLVRILIKLKSNIRYISRTNLILINNIF